MAFASRGSRHSVIRPSGRPITPVLVAQRRFAEEVAATDDGVHRSKESELRKSACHAKDAYYRSKHWAKQHNLCLPQVPLPRALMDIIMEWFCLVDDDGSGSLTAEELEAAFMACDVPCDKRSIKAMVDSITSEGRHGSEIYWQDFRTFMTGEFIAGKNLLHGDYVLPGGQSLPFGLIIKRLKRQQLLEKIMAGGEQRDTVTKQHHEACLRLQEVQEGTKLTTNKDTEECRIISLGESLANERHVMNTSGGDTFDNAVDQFVRQAHIEEIVAAEKARLLRVAEATQKLRDQSMSISASRRSSRRSLSGRSPSLSGASETEAAPHKRFLDRWQTKARSQSERASTTAFNDDMRRSMKRMDSRSRSESGRGKIASRRERQSRRSRRLSYSRHNCLRWNISIIQRVLRFDSDPEIPPESIIDIRKSGSGSVRSASFHEEARIKEDENAPFAVGISNTDKNKEPQQLHSSIQRVHEDAQLNLESTASFAMAFDDQKTPQLVYSRNKKPLKSALLGGGRVVAAGISESNVPVERGQDFPCFCFDGGAVKSTTASTLPQLASLRADHYSPTAAGTHAQRNPVGMGMSGMLEHPDSASMAPPSLGLGMTSQRIYGHSSPEPLPTVNPQLPVQEPEPFAEDAAEEFKAPATSALLLSLPPNPPEHKPENMPKLHTDYSNPGTGRHLPSQSPGPGPVPPLEAPHSQSQAARKPLSDPVATVTPIGGSHSQSQAIQSTGPAPQSDVAAAGNSMASMKDGVTEATSREWNMFLSQCHSMQRTAAAGANNDVNSSEISGVNVTGNFTVHGPSFSTPPTPSLFPLIPTTSRATMKENNKAHSSRAAAPSFLGGSDAPSTPDIDPKAVGHLWREMGRNMPQNLRFDSLPRHSWLLEAEDSADMLYEPDAILDDVVAAEKATKVAPNSAFKAPKLGVGTLRTISKPLAPNPGKHETRAHQKPVLAEKNAKNLLEREEKDLQSRAQVEEGVHEEPHVKFSVHEVHAIGTAKPEYFKQPRKSSLRGGGSFLLASAGALPARQSLSFLDLTAPCQVDVPCTSDVDGENDEDGRGPDNDSNSMHEAPLDTATSSKLSMYINTIKSHMRERQIHWQECSEGGLSPHSAVNNNHPLPHSSYSDSSSSCSDDGSFGSSSEGLNFRPAARLDSRPAASQYDQIVANHLDAKNMCHMISRVPDVVPKRFKDKYKQKDQELHHMDGPGAVGFESFLDSSRPLKADEMMRGRSKTWKNDWALNSCTYQPPTTRMSSKITWTAAVQADKAWTDAAKTVLQAVHLGPVRGMPSLQRRVLLGETDGQRLIEADTLKFNPWDDIPLQLEHSFQQQCNGGGGVGGA